jgi:hypothetical protein
MIDSTTTFQLPSRVASVSAQGAHEAVLWRHPARSNTARTATERFWPIPSGAHSPRRRATSEQYLFESSRSSGGSL